MLGWAKIVAADRSTVNIQFRKIKGREREDETLVLENFIAVKGWKAVGNMLHASPVLSVRLVSTEVDSPTLPPEPLDATEPALSGIPSPELEPGTHNLFNRPRLGLVTSTTITPFLLPTKAYSLLLAESR